MKREAGFLLGAVGLAFAAVVLGSELGGRKKGKRHMKTRDAAIQLLDAYTPAAEVPLASDPPLARAHFDEIAGDFFKAEHTLRGTTCGYVPEWLLYRLGMIDDRIIDRTAPEDGLTYIAGQQIARLISGAKLFNAWRVFVPGAVEPEKGDPVYYFREGPGGAFQGGEHVNVFKSSDGASWTTYDGGRGPDPQHQRIELVTRPLFNGGRELAFSGGPREIVGFVSLSALFDEEGEYDVSDKAGA